MLHDDIYNLSYPDPVGVFVRKRRDSIAEIIRQWGGDSLVRRRDIIRRIRPRRNPTNATNGGRARTNRRHAGGVGPVEPRQTLAGGY